MNKSILYLSNGHVHLSYSQASQDVNVETRLLLMDGSVEFEITRPVKAKTSKLKAKLFADPSEGIYRIYLKLLQEFRKT